MPDTPGRLTDRNYCCSPGACGTGGFQLAAYEYMKGQSNDRKKIRKLRYESFAGIDIVDEVVRRPLPYSAAAFGTQIRGRTFTCRSAQRAARTP